MIREGKWNIFPPEYIRISKEKIRKNLMFNFVFANTSNKINESTRERIIDTKMLAPKIPADFHVITSSATK